MFLYFGLRVLVSNATETEFERFGLSRFWKLSESRGVLGSVGLMLGYVAETRVVFVRRASLEVLSREIPVDESGEERLDILGA